MNLLVTPFRSVVAKLLAVGWSATRLALSEAKLLFLALSCKSVKIPWANS